LTETNNIIVVFILVINQLDAQNLFYNKFISLLLLCKTNFVHQVG